MGKIRTRVLGYEDIEEEQKKKQKERAKEKKAKKFTKSEEAQQQETVEEFSKKADIEVPEDMKKTEKKEKQAQKEAKSTQRKKHYHGKKYKEALKKIDQEKLYSLEEAVKLLKKVKYAHFDETVELHLQVEKKGLKGEVMFPHETGKSVRVRILDDATLQEIEEGTIAFDILIAHPSQMGKLAKFAKILGPKGLMPNPKAGTVTPNPEEVVKKFEKGTVQWKTEPKFPLIHQVIAKTSLDDKKIIENATVFLDSVKKNNTLSAYMTTSMGPSVKIDVQNLSS